MKLLPRNYLNGLNKITMKIRQPSFWYLTIGLMMIMISCSSLKKNTQAPVEFQLYVLAGQSNMAGRGRIDSLSKNINAEILMLSRDNKWVPATDPVHFDKPTAGVGPAIAFAEQMLLAQKGKSIRIGLIPCAVGGSAISAWKPGGFDKATDTYPYDQAIKRARIAARQGVIKGVLWHQGESDNSAANAKIYLNNLSTVISNFRTDLGADLPFLAGEIGEFKKNNYINPIIKLLPSKVSHTAVVSSVGLTDIGDQTHFDSNSARELGRRYALSMLQLQK